MGDYLDTVLGLAVQKARRENDSGEQITKEDVTGAAAEAFDEVVKGRRYVDDPSEAPEGVEVQEGERGGMYYEVDTTGADPDQGADQQSPPESQDDFQSPGGSPLDTELPGGFTIRAQARGVGRDFAEEFEGGAYEYRSGGNVAQMIVSEARNRASSNLTDDEAVEEYVREALDSAHDMEPDIPSADEHLGTGDEGEGVDSSGSVDASYESERDTSGPKYTHYVTEEIEADDVAWPEAEGNFEMEPGAHGNTLEYVDANPRGEFAHRIAVDETDDGSYQLRFHDNTDREDPSGGGALVDMQMYGKGNREGVEDLIPAIESAMESWPGE